MIFYSKDDHMLRRHHHHHHYNNNKKKRKEKKTWEKEKGQQIRKSTPLIISNVQMHAQDTEQSMYFDLVAIWIELKGYSQLCKYIYIFKYYFSILLWSKFFGNQ